MFCGGAEFIRDRDIAVLADTGNRTRLESALDDLQAQCIPVSPADWEFLNRGHAIHFRCLHPDALNMRLDIMTKMRGCDDFKELWKRRRTLEDESRFVYVLHGIESLVKAEKQRDRDWPMIRRLVDAHYDEFKDQANEDRVQFGLRESRILGVLLAIATSHSRLCEERRTDGPLLVGVLTASRSTMREALRE